MRFSKLTEHHVQSAYFDRIRLQWPNCKLIYAVPNGANKSIMARMKFKREGLTPGILDVNIDFARGGYNGMRIEFKRERGMRFSEEQQETTKQLEREGYLVQLHYDDQLAYNETLSYMRGEIIRIQEAA